MSGASAIGWSRSAAPSRTSSGHLACLKGCGLVIDWPGERRQVFYRLAGSEVADLLVAAERLLVANGAAIQLCRNPMMGGRVDG